LLQEIQETASESANIFRIKVVDYTMRVEKSLKMLWYFFREVFRGTYSKYRVVQKTMKYMYCVQMLLNHTLIGTDGKNRSTGVN